jgi:hypothetical protein
MIADLNGEDLPRRSRFHLARKMISPLLDLRKCAHRFALHVDDGDTFAVSSPRRLPGLENRIV